MPVLAVALLAAADAEAGWMQLAWDKPSDEVTTGYYLRYGTAESGKFDNRVDVGLVFSHVVEGLDDSTQYCFVIQAYDALGEVSPTSQKVCGAPDGSAPPPDDDGDGDQPIPAEEIVMYASKSKVLKGHWASVSSATAAGGRALRSTNKGWSALDRALSSPTHYFEVSFYAPANTPYRLWLRMRALNDAKANDSVWVQFSDAMAGAKAIYRIGSGNGLLVNLEQCGGCALSSWGWQNTAYWLTQRNTLTFARSGMHTLRVQTREDGVEIDQIVLSPADYRTSPPGQLVADATILPETVAPAGSGTNLGDEPPPDEDLDGDTPATIREIILHTSDASVRKGNWTIASSADAAGGKSMRSANDGWATADAPHDSPSNHFDLRFDASANTPYRVWLRLRAGGNSKWNDSVWVQFSDALVNGAPDYHIGTSRGLLVNLERCDRCGVSGWGWQNGAYWLTQDSMVSFSTGGTKTIRIQTREDGVEVDQVVLSAVEYATRPPGAIVNDETILPKTGAAATRAPFGGAAIALPGPIAAAEFDEGGPGVAYADTTEGNSGGEFRSTDVDLQRSVLGGYNIGWTDAGEWVSYTVNVERAGTYTARVQVASPGGGTMTIAAGAPSSDTRTVAVPSTGAWDTWTSVSVPITLAAGEQVITVRFLTEGVNLHSIVIR